MRRDWLDELRRQFASLPAEYFATRRWYRDKGRRARRISLRDACLLASEPPSGLICLVDVEFDSGPRRQYQLLGVLSKESEDGPFCEETQREIGCGELCFNEAGEGSVAFHQLLQHFDRQARVDGGSGVFEFSFSISQGAKSSPGKFLSDGGSGARPLGVDQSNSGFVLGEALLYKMYRVVEDGPQPEIEMISHLSNVGFRSMPRAEAQLTYRAGGCEYGLGMLFEFLGGSASCWEALVEDLAAGSRKISDTLPAELGHITAEMHAALESMPEVGDQPASSVEELSASIRELASKAGALLEGQSVSLTDSLPEVLDTVLKELSSVSQASVFQGRPIRIHGDYHLGQVLKRGGELSIVDFEGEPARSVNERRRSASALKDVAGMLRSFGYARAIAGQALSRGPEQVEYLENWEADARQDFLNSYWARIESLGASGLIPAMEWRVALLDGFELEKVLYEICYESRNRPDFVWVPLLGVERFCRSRIT